MSAVLNYSGAWWEIRARRVNIADLPRAEARTRRQSSVAEFDPLAVLAGELDDSRVAENYNGFILRSNPNVYAKAHNYLDTMRTFNALPRPELTPDGEGGLDIEWENKGRHLALSIRSIEGEPDFISWREPEGRYEGAKATQGLLSEKLEWLNS